MALPTSRRRRFCSLLNSSLALRVGSSMAEDGSKRGRHCTSSRHTIKCAATGCNPRGGAALPSSLAGLLGMLAVGVAGAADIAAGTVAATGGAELATVVDDLQVQVIPSFRREQFFQVPLGLDHTPAIGQPPALGEAVDMG